MVRLVSDCIRAKPAAEWLGQLEGAGIPAGPINSVTQALADVQAQHRGMVRHLAGMPLVGSPLRLDGERADSDLPPPRLGEHTGEVLHALGVAVDEVERLRAAGVVA
jgi:crotonobetainyl-CoA:carnitine CoA-transferase CaiB-like acyl-CoA transferase